MRTTLLAGILAAGALLSRAPAVVAQALVNHGAHLCATDILRAGGFRALVGMGPQAAVRSTCAASVVDFSRASQLHPTKASARWSATAAIARADYQTAYDLLQDSGSCAEWLNAYWQSLAAHGLRRFDEAASCLGRADNSGRALDVFADRLLGIGEIDSAVHYEKAAVARHPDSPDAHFKLAEALYRRGRDAEAIDEYRSGFKSPRPPTVETGEIAYHLALLLGGRGAHAEAITVMNGALAARPQYPPYLGYVAAMYLAMGDRANALKRLDELVRAAPSSGYPHCEYGRYYLAVGATDRAADEFARATQLDPAGPAYYYGDLGAAYLHQGNIEKARAALREAVRRSPGNQTYRDWLLSAEQPTAKK